MPGVIWYTLPSETSPPLPLCRRASQVGLRCDSYSCRRVFTSRGSCEAVQPVMSRPTPFPSSQVRILFIPGRFASHCCHCRSLHLVVSFACWQSELEDGGGGGGGGRLRESDGVCCKMMDGLRGHQETSYMTKNMDVFGTWGRRDQLILRMLSTYVPPPSPQSLVFARICSLNVLMAARAAALLHLL